MGSGRAVQQAGQPDSPAAPAASREGGALAAYPRCVRCTTMPADGNQVREQSTATEHWQGHFDVPRPEPDRRVSRQLLLRSSSRRSSSACSRFGVLALWSQQADSPDVFAWGVVVISITCVVVVAALVLPLHMAINSQWVTGWNLIEPLPLVTPALAILSFSAPSIVALVVLLVSAW